MEVRVPHRLERDEAVRRLLAAAERLELSMRPGKEHHMGRATKNTPMGPVEATWEAFDEEILVTVENKPAFLPGSMVERLLKEGLGDALA